jgi:hypothetical protein
MMGFGAVITHPRQQSRPPVSRAFAERRFGGVGAPNSDSVLWTPRAIYSVMTNHWSEADDGFGNTEPQRRSDGHGPVLGNTGWFATEWFARVPKRSRETERAISGRPRNGWSEVGFTNGVTITLPRGCGEQKQAGQGQGDALWKRL